MGYFQIVFVYFQVVVQKDVDVNGAVVVNWCISSTCFLAIFIAFGLAFPFSAHFPLDGLRGFEHLTRRQAGLQAYGGIEEQV